MFRVEQTSLSIMLLEPLNFSEHNEHWWAVVTFPWRATPDGYSGLGCIAENKEADACVLILLPFVWRLAGIHQLRSAWRAECQMETTGEEELCASLG